MGGEQIWIVSAFNRPLQDSAKALKAAAASEELFKSQKNKPQPELFDQFGWGCQSSRRIFRFFTLYALFAGQIQI